ncbi:MAG: hypothetical protein ACI8S3_000356 [Alphaproteobacteria bacterium]|jgi:hypothetical protein
MNGPVSEPEKFFRELGGLHDARIQQVLWSPEHREIAFTVDDLNSNSEGFPEYQGLFPQVVILEGVADITVSFAPIESHLNVYDFKVTTESASQLRVDISFWPGGSISVLCAELRLEDPEGAPESLCK